MILHRVLDLVFTAVFLGIVGLQSVFVMRHNERMFRSLHAYEYVGEHNIPPTSYFALDWLMHPLKSHYKTTYIKPLLSSTRHCYTSGMGWDVGNCGPELWQTAHFCPQKNAIIPTTQIISMLNSQTGGAVDAKILLSQLSHENEKTSLEVNSTHVFFRNPNLADVCRIERTPDITVMQNDDSSWSISAAHSSSVLLLGAALVMFISNLTNLMHDPPDNLKHYASQLMGFKAVIVVAMVLLLFVVRFVSAGDEDVVARVVPNGSYFYVVATVVFGGYLLTSMKKKFEATPDYPVAELDGPISGQSMGYPLSRMDLNVSGFATQHKTQINAYMPRTAPPLGTGQVVGEDAYDSALLLDYASFKKVHMQCDIQPSRFCITQALVLPLLTLGIFVFPTNYEMDTQIQLLFVTVVLYGIVDVAIHRLDNVTCIVSSLLISDVQKKSKFTKICRWVDVLGLLAQVVLFTAIFVYMHWHLTVGLREMVPVIGKDSLFESVMGWMPILYILYFAISTIVKILAVYTTNRKDKYVGQERVKLSKVLETIHTKSQFILFSNLNVFVAGMMVVMSMYMFSEQYKHPITVGTAKNVMLEKTIKMYRSSVSV